MNYTVYDITEHSPSLKERDSIWSVLLFGDKVQITSLMALPFIVYGEFKYYPEKQKFEIYRFFKPTIESVTTWEIFDEAIKFILHQRKKKFKTGLEVKDLAGREVWLRKTEKWFETSLRDNLAKYNYEEIVPLTLRFPDQPEPDVTMTIPREMIELDEPSVAEEHFVKIITNALSQTDNIFVFDDRLLPFIEQHKVNEASRSELLNAEKVTVFSEKVFNMPLCYKLKSDEIKMARAELTQHFKSFHEIIHSVTTGEEDLMAGMAKLRSVLPELQDKIESSNFVLSMRNRLPEVPAVAMHLGFTSKRGIPEILKELDMFTEEHVLQAGDLLLKESNLDRLQPFMFPAHRQPPELK